MPRSKATAKPSGKGKGLEPAKKNLASQKIQRKTAPVTTGVKEVRKRRSRPGQAALRQIKRYQKSTELLTQKAPIHRRIRQIAQQYAASQHVQFQRLDRHQNNIRFQAQAINAIQEAVQVAVIGLFEDAYLCTNHAKRVTLFESDVILARRIRGDSF